MTPTLKIGTRGSQLALWQAQDLKSQLETKGISSELIIIKTKGDQVQNLSFDKIEGKGFFTKEIEDALILQEVDVAVHSMKDLPTQGDDRLKISAVSSRANPRDVLIIKEDYFDTTSPPKIKTGAKVGTSSIRRKVQFSDLYPLVDLVDIRGNVPTRINKIREGIVDGVILASAGIDRLALNLSDFRVFRFNPSEFIPAPAQGVIAYQCRRDDIKTSSLLKLIHHSDIASCTNVERGLLRLLDGGCQLPLGAYCQKDGAGNYHAHAVLGSTPGAPLKKVTYSQSTTSNMSNRLLDLLHA